MNSQKGFTLIELVVVIVILGILAAVAAPKFIDISSDARKSTLAGVEGSLKGANSLVYSKAVIEGIQKLDCTANGVTCSPANINGAVTTFGYATGTVAALTAILDVDSSDFTIATPGSGIASSADVNVIIHPTDLTPSATLKCFVEYTDAASVGAQPTYNVVDTNC